MKDLYSSIASSYSSLAKLIFGQALFKAKVYFIEPSISKNLLIAGGGDGVDYQGFSTQLQGDYWEMSSSMLDLAKQNLEQSDLAFHLGDFGQSKKSGYDEVWLHFVLDTLPDLELVSFLKKVKALVKPDTLIHLVDFFPPQTLWQRVIQFAMMQFFRIAASHPRNDIPDYEHHLESLGFKKVKEKIWKKGWIRSQIWKIKDTFPPLSK